MCGTKVLLFIVLAIIMQPFSAGGRHSDIALFHCWVFVVFCTQVIKFKAQGVSIDMLFCSLHYQRLPIPCNVHVEVYFEYVSVRTVCVRRVVL